MSDNTCIDCGGNCGRFDCEARKYAPCDCPNLATGKESCNDFHELNDSKIKLKAQRYEKLLVCDIPGYLGKVFGGIACVFKNLTLQLCWILDNVNTMWHRTEVLEHNNKGMVEQQQTIAGGMAELHLQMTRIVLMYNQYATNKVNIQALDFNDLVCVLKDLPEDI